MTGEIRIVAALVGRAENGDELPGEALCQHKRHRAHQRFGNQQPGEQLPDTQLFLRAHVIAHNGNAARRHANDDGNDDLEELHHDAHDGHGNLGVLLLPENCIQRAVFAEHIVDGRHRRHQADLGEEAGNAQRQHPSADMPLQGIVAGARA